MRPLAILLILLAPGRGWARNDHEEQLLGWTADGGYLVAIASGTRLLELRRPGGATRSLCTGDDCPASLAALSSYPATSKLKLLQGTRGKRRGKRVASFTRRGNRLGFTVRGAGQPRAVSQLYENEECHFTHPRCRPRLGRVIVHWSPDGRVVVFEVPTHHREGILEHVTRLYAVALSP